MRRSALTVAVLAFTSACAPRGAGPHPLAAAAVAPAGPSRQAGPASGASATARSEPVSPCVGRTGPTPVALPEQMTLSDFWQALAAQVSLLDTTSLDGTFLAFAGRHQLDPRTPGLRQVFVRLWLAFEATRDGGWWRLRWDITDQEPSSIKIWKAWLKSPPAASFDAPSAVAECDEITALFSVTARHLGVRGVGLFYPTWNHVIAGWTPHTAGAPGPGPVVLVPTTQIFQGCESTFDQTSFVTPKRVYEYPRGDISGSTEMSPALAAFLLEQVRQYGQATPELLALVRTKRAELLRSSVGNCAAYREKLASDLAGRLTCADQRALQHLASQELGLAQASDSDVLAWLASAER